MARASRHAERWKCALRWPDNWRMPSALIMRVEPPNIKVLVASEAEGNPYEPGEKPRIAWSANELRGLSAFGSVRKITDEAGAVTDSRTYSAFGELISKTGTDALPYQFAGEPFDADVGFSYHRARWMDPRVGRFASRDPFDGLILERFFGPRSLAEWQRLSRLAALSSLRDFPEVPLPTRRALFRDLPRVV